MPDDRKRAARHPPVAPRELRRDRAASSAASAVSAMSASAARRLAVEPAAQQLHADLEIALAGPAPREIERVLVIGAPAEHVASRSAASPARSRQGLEEPVGSARRRAGRAAAPACRPAAAPAP